MNHPFAECWVCGGEIQHAEDAVPASETPRDPETGNPGSVRYRHDYCDPRDREHVPTMWM